MNPHLFKYNKRFPLENGQYISELQLAYHTYGTLNPDASNVIWVCHALTANSDVFDWWKGLFGEQDLFNPQEHFIVCVNNLGSCYGSTGPLSPNRDTKEPLFNYFPEITTKDIARSLDLLRAQLGIKKIYSLIGGSQGGQIALEWSLLNANVTENLILIATNAQHSPWGIAFNESQRLAIKADRTYYSNLEDAAQKGLAAARSIALLSYRSYDTYAATQNDSNFGKTGNYLSASYQRYQGEKFIQRFNAYSYVRLLNAMDSHNVARGRADSVEEALIKIKAKTLIISITSDILFPVEEQRLLATYIPGAVHKKIDSVYGHDGFLIETQQLSLVLKDFFQNQKHKTLKSQKTLVI